MNPQEIEQLWEKAKKLQEQDLSKEAIVIYEQLLEQDLKQEVYWEIAFELNELYRLSYNSHDKGKPMLEALEVEKLPVDLKIKRLLKLYKIELNSSNFEIASEYIEQAYQLSQEHTKDELTLLKIRCEFADSRMYTAPPNYELSVQLSEEILEEALSKKDAMYQDIVLTCYYHLLKGNLQLGQLEKAEKYFHLGRERNKTLHNYRTEADMCMIYYYVAIRKSTKLAIEILEQGVKCFKKHHKEKWHQSMHYGIVNLFRAELEIKRLDYFEALYYLKIVQNMAEKNNYFYFLASLYTHFITIYIQNREYEKAIYYAHQNYDLNVKKDPEGFFVAFSLNLLGDSYLQTDPLKAHDYYKKTLAFLEEQNQVKTTSVYEDCHQGLLASCKKSEIETYVQKLLQHLDSITDLPILRASIYTDIAQKYLSSNLDSSIEYAHLSLNKLLLNKELNLEDLDIDWQNEVWGISNIWKPLTILAKAYFKKHQETNNVLDLQYALNCFNASVEVLNTIQNSYKAEGSKLLFNEQLPTIFGEALKVLITLKSTDYLEQTFRFIEAGKAKVLQAGLTEGRAKKLLEGSALYEQEQELKGELQVLEIQVAQSKEKDEQLYQNFFAKRKAYKKVIQEMEATYPEYKQLKYQNTVLPLQQIQKQLSENQLLLNYFLNEESVFIQFVSEDETELVEMPIDENFPEIVRQFVQSIKLMDRLAFHQKAHKLSQILIQPIADLIIDIFGSEELKQLIIIPHSYLSQIPFETLFTNSYTEGEQPEYLIHQFDISYHYSASLWGLQQQQLNNKTVNYEFLGMAPVYEKTQETVADNRSYYETENMENIEWDHLPFSENEVNELSQLFEPNQAKCFVKQAASKTTFLKEAENANIVHLAAHFHQHEQPKLSGLVFDNNEKLYIKEAFNLDLNAKLFVLSACESAVGKLYQSEGMMAINRGLLYSGVQDIVSTLFVVNDNQAYHLMSYFYQNLLEGQSPVAALGKAKRAFLAQDKDILPIYWASFILIGG